MDSLSLELPSNFAQVYLTAAVMNLKKLAALQPKLKALQPLITALFAATKRLTARLSQSQAQWRQNITDVRKWTIHLLEPSAST